MVNTGGYIQSSDDKSTPDMPTAFSHATARSGTRKGHAESFGSLPEPGSIRARKEKAIGNTCQEVDYEHHQKSKLNK